MKDSIRSVFEEECSHLVADMKLLKRIQNYAISFVNKNEDHIEFFGGNLTGVQVVRFLDSDRNRWFSEILEVDEEPVAERLHALPEVDTDWKISSDAMNLSCVYLCYFIYNSKHLNDVQKHDGMIDVVSVLQYKYLTSLLYHYFRYPASRATAEATYAQLSYKYNLKQCGSWSAFLLMRSEDIISKDGIHHNVIQKLDKDGEVIEMLNDTQGRIRDTLKNICNVFMTMHKSGVGISTVSSIMEHNHSVVLKDKTKNLLTYGHYLNSIVTDKNSFIREELADIVEKLMHTMPPKLFRETLVWISLNYGQSGASVIEEVLNETLIHAFDYLDQNRSLVHNTADLPTLLGRLKGVYMSSRSTETTLLSLREKTEEIVKNATDIKSESLISSIRTGILLYIVLRSLTMNYYTSSV